MLTQQDFNDAFTLLLGGLGHEVYTDRGIEWEENGYKVYIAFDSCSPQEAIVRRYYEDGKTLYKQTYRNGKRHGKQLYYHDNERISVEQNYEDGELHGECINYYHNGKIKNRYNYRNGIIQGKWTNYYVSGKIESEIDYCDGVQNGKWISYYVDGKTIRYAWEI